MKLKKIFELLKEDRNISEPTVYNNYGYEIVVCSESWIKNHTYAIKDTVSRMYIYSGYIGSKPVKVDVREMPYLSRVGLVILFHYEYEDGRRPLSSSTIGPSDVRKFAKEMKKLSKTSTKPIKNTDRNVFTKSNIDKKSSSSDVIRRPGFYYVFFQDISHGHSNEVSDPIEFKIKQDAIDRSTDEFTYNKRDKNGMKTWVEDSRGNVIFVPKDGSSAIFNTRR